jgi:uncharacterized protein YbjT (DUF2867 family)
MFVVAGVSGNTGSVVASTLLERGAKVRVVVRDAKKGEAWAARGAEVAVAELSDAKALTKALEGAKGAYLLIPPAVTETDVFAAQQKVLDGIVAAVRDSKLPHLVFLSSIAAQHPSGNGPIHIVHRAEKALSPVLANVTYVRAAYFMENLAGSLGALPHGVFPTFQRKDLAIPMIATRDIGVVAATALLEGPRGHSVIELEGPARHAPGDVAKTLTEITGKALEVQFAPEEAIVPTFLGFGFSAHMSELYREMIVGMNAGTMVFEGGAAIHVTGKTPLRDVLSRLLAG